VFSVYIYIYIYIYVEREREREKDKERAKKRERERNATLNNYEFTQSPVYPFVCLFVCVCVYV
jgi:hypothetical protein